MKKAPRNQTLQCDEEEMAALRRQLLALNRKASAAEVRDKIINQDFFKAAAFLPSRFADLLVLDPPYNISKNYNGEVFRERDERQYAEWFDSVLRATKPLLSPHASVYVCADWKTSVIVAPLLARHFYVRNRITWERDKGRGAKTNWKNNMEDIWFCTMGAQYVFNLDAVKIKRKVLAPYRANGSPKDWREDNGGRRWRLTHPSNVWTDLSVPFWSMPENTDHPTQKPEKLLAKILLASSCPGDTVFDPFAGSGTTAVVAKKLGRHFVSVEIDETYCCWGQKRLQRASQNAAIQGYVDGVFWERNSGPMHRAGASANGNLL